MEKIVVDTDITEMNGAEALIRTAVAAGIEACFANPGTTEMPLVMALDAVPGIRAVLGLFEGVCTGAADGYARMAGKPALTLLHLGPGFANGIANLHNARRARSPIVNLIGEHATWHVSADAPLTSDIVSLARPVSAWVRRARSAKGLSKDVAEAIAAASQFPGQVASMIIPTDCQMGTAKETAYPHSPEPPASASGATIAGIADALQTRKPAALLLGVPGLRGRGLHAAARIAAASGCKLLCDTFPARLERGAGIPEVERLPYFAEQVIQALSGYATLILAGTVEPVAFFGYPGMPSRLTPKTCTLDVLTRPHEDTVSALEALAEMLHAPAAGAVPQLGELPRPKGPLNPQSLGQALASLQPEGIIVVDEAATSGFPHFMLSAGCPPFSYLSLTGGAIGQGLPCATGAALACPDRKVLAFEADGSGMYTLQALWSHAREGLNITTVICANRSYRVLRMEMARAGINEPGPKAVALTDLSHPILDWVNLARGLGIPAVRAETAEVMVEHLERAFSEPGPHLIEAVL
jgi:acetolactate synthase-1/2/3 large subunit